MNIQKQTIIHASIGLLIGVLLTATGFVMLNDNTSVVTNSEKNPLYWVAPMDPNYRRDTPGKSPMGMDLVPVYEESSSDEPGTVTIDPTMTQNLGVRTAEVVRDKLKTDLTGVGVVQFNPETLIRIVPRVEGWIEELFVAANGEYVNKGDALYSLYSPELVNAQEELVLALNRGNKPLKDAAVRRLSALQVGEEFISRLEKTKRVQRAVVFAAPQPGFVDQLMALPGAFVKPSESLMVIANLDDIWVEVELLESQAALVSKGMDATMNLMDGSNRLRVGNVEYVYPTVDPKTRSVKVRLRFSNTDHAIKPNMFAGVSLAAVAMQESLLVPREALIRTAKETRVVRALGDGKFRSVKVETGRIADDFAQIVNGLNEGERVVTSAQFLIDSESDKSAEMSRMSMIDAGEGSVSAPTEVWTEASVTKLMPEMGMVELSHEPITEWNWPAMRMSFTASETADIAQLKVGDRIRAQLTGSNDAGYQILQWQPHDDIKALPKNKSRRPDMLNDDSAE